jgi:transcriptional regulator with GAF, ATPase, and Fis domain/tetratricopeptide (TPR) repeat protein
VLVNGRWEITSKIGDGGMGRVHLARDRHQGGREVALKILKPGLLDREAIGRFRDEFLSLARLRHPHLAEVYDFGLLDGDGAPFLTMEYVAGHDLASLPRDPARTAFEELAVQCLRALDFIHGRGWRHNDIKPQNIMVAPRFHVKLLDFGLARRLGDQGRLEPSGTLHYLAPEVLSGKDTDARADLYALGVVLYEILAGRRPFDAARPGEVITAILRGEAGPIADRESRIPARWRSLVAGLMALRPEDRPASAEAALALLNAGAATRVPLDTTETFAAWIGSGPIVGRSEARRRLGESIRTHLDGGETEPRAREAHTPHAADAPRVVVLTGATGAGKSRVLRETRQDLQLAGQRTLEGRCDEGSGDPLQPFGPLLRAARVSPGLPPTLGAAIDQALGRAGDGSMDRPRRGRPRAGGVASVPSRLEKAELVSALGASLDHLAGGAAGVLFLENLQWAGTPALALLEHLLLRDHAPRWLVVASLRQDDGRTPGGETAVGRLLERPRLVRVPLATLDAGDTTELLTATLPSAAPLAELARRLFDRTGGNPLHIEEVLKALFSGGHLERRAGGWALAPAANEELPLPPTLVALLLRDLEALPEGQLQAVRMLAVFGKPVSLDILARSLALSAAETRATVTALQHRGLVGQDWSQGDEPRVSFAQSSAGAALYSALRPTERKPLHRAAATSLEAAGPDRADLAEDLALHCEKGGKTEEAIDYLLRAAERAAAIHDPRRRAALLERALALLPSSDTQRRLATLDVLCVIQQNDLGDQHAGLEAAGRLRSEARRARALQFEIRGVRHEAWALQFLGRSTEARAAGRRALTMARRAGETHEIAATLSYLGVILARGGEPRAALSLFEEALPLERNADDPTTLTWVLNNAALGHLGLGEYDDAARLLDEVLEVAKRHGLTGAYHRFLSNVGTVRLDRGDLPGAIAAFEEGLTWSRQHTVLELTALQCESLVVARLQEGRPDLALARQQEASRCRGLVGARPGPLGLDLRGQCERELGRFAEAIAAHEQGLAAARTSGDRVQEGYLVAALATDLLEAGDTEGAVARAREAGILAQDLGHARIGFLAHRVLALVAAGGASPGAPGDGAREGATDVEALRGRMAATNEKTLRYHDRLERQRVLACLLLRAGDPEGAERATRAGREAALRGGFREAAWRLGVILGEALERRGLRGQAEEIRDDVRKSIEDLAGGIEEETMKDDYMKHPERAAATRPGGGIPAPATTGADTASRMLATLFEVTQVINSIHDPEELLDKVMDLAIEMVGAERGLIFLSGEDGVEMEPVVARNVERQTIRDATAYSRSILREAGRGRSILTHDAEHDARFREYRSVLRFHIRSLMCVPLTLRGKTIGTVYVDTRAPGSLFTPETLKFLEAFATQAAIAVDNARLIDRVRRENETLKQAVQDRYGFESIVGTSPRMREVFAVLARVAPSPLPVVVRGESGTGKELVARAIHLNSPRRDKPFYSENCAALPDNLLESELFGHVRGAFTGAESSRKGVFELADGGTLFLDEVGDMSLTLQSKLLRVLQNGEIRPVGSESTRKVSVRIVSATNRDLEAMVRQRTFREDLYYRLKGVSVTLPPLRERREDVPLLVNHFLAKLARENSTPRLRVEPALLRELSLRRWPGNVRELENTVYRLTLFAGGETLTLTDARQDAGFAEDTPTGGPGASQAESLSGPVTRQTLKRAIAAAHGNRNQAARLLGISRATIFRRLRDLGVSGAGRTVSAAGAQVGQGRQRPRREP